MTMDNKPGAGQFGDTAMRLGYLRDDQIRDALGDQERQRQRGDVPSPMGLLLHEKGMLTPAQITAVLRQLSGGELPLSEDGIRLAARVKVIHAATSNVVGVTASVSADATRALAELAVGLALLEQGKVLAVDANVREPSLHTLLDTPAAPGFVEHIALGSAAPQPLTTRVAALAVVPAGGPARDVVSLCMSPEAAQLLDGYRSRYRYVLVNLGQITRQAEAAVTASRCDGVLVVLRSDLSQKGELRDMQRMLSGLNVGLSGIVLTAPSARQERLKT